MLQNEHCREWKDFVNLVTNNKVREYGSRAPIAHAPSQPEGAFPSWRSASCRRLSGRHDIFPDVVMTARVLFMTFLLAGPLAAALSACDPWFSFSPFTATVPDRYHDTNAKNLERIEARDADDGAPFKIALISDPHYHYSKLRDAVADINRRAGYQFVIVIGDLSENGLLQEFILFHQVMANLRIPYLTVIGNHDYLANGSKVYEEMYGPFNYTFVYNNCLFVMWDNTTVESGKEADMDWFAQHLENAGRFDHVLPVCHIPPNDQQMKANDSTYRALLEAHGIGLSLHGHKHEFSVEEVKGVRYVTVSSPQKRAYTELSVTPSGLEIRKIEY